MRQALQAIANGKGFIELPDFLRCALYDDELGYYRQDQQRVGRSAQTDFYTASTFKDALAQIAMEAASQKLQRIGLDPQDTVWVEIGAEPKAALLQHIDHPFADARALHLGDTLTLDGQLVVFSNELFDAQPFRQLRFEEGNWGEYGLHWEDDRLAWQRRSELHAEVSPYADRLPEAPLEGYVIDLPTGARQLADSLLQQPWQGVFIALDYGKTWHQLIHDTPQGTARCYAQHQQSNNILESPGKQDITHHVCWDDLEDCLAKNRFANISLQSQESFVVHQAPQFLQSVFDPQRPALDPLRSQLKELIHPALMGQKFQALSATRLA